MKNSKMLGMVLATAVLASATAVGTAGAAVSTKAGNAGAKATVAQSKAANVKLTVDGSQVPVKTVTAGKTTLYSLRDLANALDADIKLSGGNLVIQDASQQYGLSLKIGSKDYRVNGETLQFGTAPQQIGGTVYVELSPVVEALGGELLSAKGEISSVGRLSGQFDLPFFDAAGNVIATKEDGEVPQLIKLDSAGRHEVFSSNESAVGAVVSPDGSQAAFTDENGGLYLLNTASGLVKQLGKDTSVKTDLSWSQDGKSIYFIQGDKQEKIAYISVDTGKVTEVLADKVENKSGVRITEDGKKVIYFVQVTGKAETDKEGTEESLKIDYSKAGTQVFSLDLATKDSKPVQLTNDTYNKLYLSVLADGRAIYVSADPDGVIPNSVLKVVSADGKNIADLAGDLDVISAVVSGGKLIVLAASENGSKVYEVASSGAKTELYSTDKDVTELTVSKTGTVGLIAEGKVVLVQGGKGTELTK
ncbi:stalk domain-containing protein [Fontibacillus sp. BL9]|uniref:stalk domain-containing protein n=1 Tax=Fontibacillus sp. BL9 TaxID=3389971 RepID=UPI003978A084